MPGTVERDFYYRCLRPQARHVLHDQFIRQRFMANLVMAPVVFFLLLARWKFQHVPSESPDVLGVLTGFWVGLMIVEMIGIARHGDPWVGELVAPTLLAAISVIVLPVSPASFLWTFLAIILLYIRLRDVRVAAFLSVLTSSSAVVVLVFLGTYDRNDIFRIAVGLLALQVLLYGRRVETVRIAAKERRTTVLLNDILEGLAQGVLVQDASGAVSHHNRRAVVLLGVEPDRVQRKPELLDIQRDASSLGMWVEHGHFRTLAGIDLQVDSQVDADGGVVTTFTDISQLQRARDSAMAVAGEKSRLLLEVGREFRAPVHALLALLKEVAGTDSDIRRRAAISRGDALGQRLLALASNRVDEISALKIVEDSVTLPMELEAFLRDVGSQLAALPGASSVDILFDVDPRLPAVLRLDGLRLRQVLLALLSNAMRLAVGGTVVLRIERLEYAGEVGKVATRWSVQDDGPGIQPSQVPGLFEGRAIGGETHGLGLPVSQYIARTLGTEIKLASVPGFGATFSFELVVGLDTSAVMFGEALRRETMDGTRVLLVATASQASEHALASLHSLGYSAESANVPMVLAKLRAAAEKGHPYGVVVLDMVNFPDGIEAFLSEVRNAGAAGVITRTVAMVGELQELQRALPPSAQGLVDSLLLKPYTPRMLFEAVSGSVLAENSNASLFNVPVSLSGMRVLLAEPQPVSRQVVGRLLLRAGCQLVAVETAEELRAQVEMRSGDFDVVLADADLCLEVGFATLRLSGRDKRAVPLSRPPLVCMSASKGPLMLHGLGAGEVSHVLQKPVDPAKLLEVLEELGAAAPKPLPVLPLTAG
jgi:signal transduction histidine kinase/CheY-like chemotaxis protein